MRYAIGLAMSGAASFRTLAGIPSRPVAFDDFSLHSSCLTNVGLTMTLLRPFIRYVVCTKSVLNPYDSCSVHEMYHDKRSGRV